MVLCTEKNRVQTPSGAATLIGAHLRESAAISSLMIRTRLEPTASFHSSTSCPYMKRSSMRVRRILGCAIAAPFFLRPVRARHRVSNISAFKVRKAVRTLARMCDVPYHRQPLTPQLRHHMVASVAQLVEHRSRKAGVTGSSPVAGSIAQDSRLRAAFLLPIRPLGGLRI